MEMDYPCSKRPRRLVRTRARTGRMSRNLPHLTATTLERCWRSSSWCSDTWHGTACKPHRIRTRCRLLLQPLPAIRLRLQLLQPLHLRRLRRLRPSRRPRRMHQRTYLRLRMCRRIRQKQDWLTTRPRKARRPRRFLLRLPLHNRRNRPWEMAGKNLPSQRAISTALRVRDAIPRKRRNGFGSPSPNTMGKQRCFCQICI